MWPRDVEPFSVQERISDPIRLVSVYRWSGESLALDFVPVAAVLFLGHSILNRYLRSRSRPL